MMSYFAYTIMVAVLSGAIIADTADPTCVPTTKDSKEGAEVINSCPDGFSGDETLKTKCSSTDDVSDPLLATLVTHQDTQATYQNLHCAECNEAPLEELLFWHILLECKDHKPEHVDVDFVEENVQYMEQDNKWGVKSKDGQVQQCDLSFERPEYLKTKECQVKSKKKRQIGSHVDQWVRWNKYKSNATKPTKGPRVTRPPIPMRVSFPILIDFNTANGDFVGLKQIEDPLCPKGEKWDPFFKKCRQLFCAIPGYEMKDEKCQKQQ